jgi:hypothetical protein
MAGAAPLGYRTGGAALSIAAAPWLRMVEIDFRKRLTYPLTLLPDGAIGWGFGWEPPQRSTEIPPPDLFEIDARLDAQTRQKGPR